MDTFDKISELMQSRKMSQADLARATGFSTGLISQWKKRMQKPSVDKLQKIADYFNVSLDYLTGASEQKEKPLVNGDEELTEYLEMLRTRPEMRMMFQLTSKATKADVEKAVKIVEALLEKEGFR